MYLNCKSTCEAGSNSHKEASAKVTGTAESKYAGSKSMSEASSRSVDENLSHSSTEKPRYCDLRCYDIPASDIRGSETD